MIDRTTRNWIFCISCFCFSSALVSSLFPVETGAKARADRLIVEFEEANFVRRKRGTFLVDVDSFNHAVNRKSETKLYWKFVECKSRGC